MRATPIEVVESALRRLAPNPALREARAALTEVREDLTERMRVALVGRVSAGKSTLANALLGGYRAPTGINELTFNVNWITHGTIPSVTVHFHDGRPPEPRPLDELERLTVRTDDPSRQDYLSSIAYLRITDPADYLKAFDLIDTPGLDSVFGADSANTLRFLDGPVDAIVLVFSRSLHGEETALLARLRGPDTSVGPINTIAALTRVETYWDWPDVPDPLPVARRVTEQAMSGTGISDLVHQLVPVASLVGAGAAGLGEPDLHLLSTLSELPVNKVGWALSSADGFATSELGDGDPARRAALFQHLHGYGVMLACDILREGVRDLATLRAELDRRSGMAGFRDLLVDHFGGRAELIKLDQSWRRIQELPDRFGATVGPRDRAALDDVVRDMARVGLGNKARFNELEMLRALYDGLLDLDPDDIADLLRITGEHGTGTAARLGLPADSGRDDRIERAQAGLRHWAELAELGWLDGPSRLAASVARRRYEIVLAGLTDVRESA